jgi:PAS domain S-box-containing protein
MPPAVGRFPVDISIFDEAPVGLGLCDRHGRFLEVSAGFATILGRRAAELVGMQYIDVVHPEDRAAAHARIVNLIAGVAGRLRHEERLVRPDGSVRWVSVITSKVPGRPAAAAAAVLRVVDVTERRQAEQDRDRVVATLAEAQAIAHVGSWDYDFASQRTTCSDELLRIFGIDPATPPLDVTALFEWVHIDDRKAVREAARESFESGAPFSTECRINRVDGAERIVQLQGRHAGHSIGGDGLIGTLQDVTAQRLAETKLREIEARFRAIFENAPVGIATVDASLRMLNVNAALADMLGERPDRLVGRTLLTVTHPDDVDRARALGRITIAGEPPDYDIENRFVRPDRHIVWARVRITLLREEVRRALYGFVLIEDITAAKEGELARRELDSLRQSLLGKLSTQERRILEHMAAGSTNRQIAQELSLAEKTVRNYVSNLFAKLAMHHRSEAAAFAARLQEGGSL